MKRLLILLLLIFITSVMWAQQRVAIKGIVKSSVDSSSLVGISILEKKTSNGTVSGTNGEFKIMASVGSTFVFR